MNGEALLNQIGEDGFGSFNKLTGLNEGLDALGKLEMPVPVHDVAFRSHGFSKEEEERDSAVQHLLLQYPDLVSKKPKHENDSLNRIISRLCGLNDCVQRFPSLSANFVLNGSQALVI